MLCFACGCVLKVGDKRRLETPEAINVVALWKHLALQDESYSESELDKLLIGSGKPEDYGKMCRKCFAAYQHLIEVADTLKNKQSEFFNAIMKPMDDAPPPAKRPRYSATTKIPTSSTLLGLVQPGASTCTSSPPVVVSCFIFSF